MNIELTQKRIRNAGSRNPKKNPSMRRTRSTEARARIGTFALKPKRTALGKIIPGRSVRFWGGRKPSKYCPVAEAIKHGVAA